MRRVFHTLVLAFSLALPGAGHAQDPIPDRFLTLTADLDAPGNDLVPVFDTTLENCAAACRADPACSAFTFNTRNASCFPKNAITGTAPYLGALTGVFTPADPAALARLDARVVQLDFLDPADVDAARAQALGLGLEFLAGGQPVAFWRNEAARALAGEDAVRAARMLAHATTASDDARDWAAYADALLDIDTERYSERQEYRRRALSAAVNATLRAAPGPDLARAADVLARALEESDRGRLAIDAARLANEEEPTVVRAIAIDRLQGLYGFRVTDTRVDVEAEFPRICAIFSEPLARGGVDFADYVQDARPGLAVEAEDRQLCLSGFPHGSRQTFTLRAGLPSASGEILAKAVTLSQFVRDRAPSVRFAGRAYILPSGSRDSLPVTVVNAPELDLALYRVPDRNLLRAIQSDYFGTALSSWRARNMDGEIGEVVWQGSAEVAVEENRAVTSRLALAEMLIDRAPGLYALQAAVASPGAEASDPATQWFVVSDLGLTTLSGADGVHVIVRSLATAEARAGATVTLVARSNRVLGEAVTDADGYAWFEAGLTRGTGGAAPALVTVAQGDDFAFLSLAEAEFDLSDRGVDGRAAPGPIDVFLTTDRGAYRPGETIHVTALARGADAEALTGLPLTAILTRADGVEYARELMHDLGAGGYVFDLDLGSEVPRGPWRLAIHADPDAAPLSTARLLVEDFLPERIDVTLGLPDGPFAPTEMPRLTVRADYLFGAPAPGLRVDGSLRLAPVREIASLPGFSFGRYDAAPRAVSQGLPRLQTGEDGSTGTPLVLPALDGPPQPAELTVTALVAEGSGRPVERQITRPVLPLAPMIGIRPLTDGVLAPDSTAELDLITTGAAPLPVRWTLDKLHTRYQWYRQDGDWRWEAITTRERIAEGDATLSGPDTARRLALDLERGEYALRVESTGGDYTVSSVLLRAGWYRPEGATDTPDRLQVSLDAESYAPGDTATLRIVPETGGVAVIQVVSDRLIDMQIVELGDAPADIALPVTAEWGTGAYVTASLIRPLQALSGPTPSRAMGLAHAAVDPGDRELTATLEAPEIIRSDSPLDVALRVDGAAPGDTVHATIAAVDLGILNLTAFQAPDPQGHYFGQRRLGIAYRDIYGRLIDAGDGAEALIRQGGDGAMAGETAPPPDREELLALFSGPLTVGTDGVARATFDLPDYNGAVRLMAVAWSQAGVGQASRDVTVRDPVVVGLSAPRYLAPGDTARLLVELTHADGPAGDMALAATASGALTLGPVPSGVTLGAGETRRLSIPVSAGEAAGPGTLTVTLTTPDGTVLSRELPLPVQVGDIERARTSRLILNPGQSITLDDALFAGLRPDTGRATVSGGPLARFDVPGLLIALDRYPYGCTEQLTSAAMPLLYLSAVAADLDRGDPTEMAARIDHTIARLMTRQSSDGTFGAWGVGWGEPWLDAYATDFLSRARALGHAVPDTGFDTALDNLANFAAAHPDFENGGEALAYALYVLAREGRAPMADLRYYADVKAGDFATPLALAQLGAALALYGDDTRANRLFTEGRALLMRQLSEPQRLRWRDDYGSALRDGMGLLALATETGSDAISATELADRLLGPGQTLSTQEALWTLLAAHALEGAPAAAPFTVDGAPLNGALVEMLEAGAGTSREIANTSGAPQPLYVTLFGVPEGQIDASGSGYWIEQRYLHLDGSPADPSRVAQGTRLVSVLTVTPTGAPPGRLMVADVLPAGFEIDNPNLLSSGDVAALDGLDLSLRPAHTEVRSDRFLAAFDRYENDEAMTLAFILRAVTPGTFHDPAASVEDMYRPAQRAQTAAGRVVVTE